MRTTLYAGGVVFSAFDQVPSDLHINAIVLGCLSFLVAFLMLIDLADPMARHTNDTTQTDFPVPTGLPAQEIKEINTIGPHMIAKPIPTAANIQVHPNRSHRTSDVVNPTNGQYVRGDEVDFVQAHMTPSAQEPIFEKLLLPEKQRPHRQNIPDPHSNRARLEYQATPAYSYEPSAQQQPIEQPNVPYRSQFDARSHQPQSYSRQSTYNLSRGPPQPRHPPHQHQHNFENTSQRHYNIRTSPTHRNPSTNRRRSSHCSNNNSSGDEDNSRAIRPGFVAHAARFWDQRAKQNEELNTIV